MVLLCENAVLNAEIKRLLIAQNPQDLYITHYTRTPHLTALALTQIQALHPYRYWYSTPHYTINIHRSG
jgi:hypothetical protein